MSVRHYYSYSAGAVALVYHLFVVVLVAVARSFLDYSVDVVVGYVVRLSLSDEVRELRVVSGVGAALLYYYRDLSAYLGEDLALYGVVSLFLSLDVCPF